MPWVLLPCAEGLYKGQAVLRPRNLVYARPINTSCTATATTATLLLLLLLLLLVLLFLLPNSWQNCQIASSIARQLATIPDSSQHCQIAGTTARQQLALSDSQQHCQIQQQMSDNWHHFQLPGNIEIFIMDTTTDNDNNHRKTTGQLGPAQASQLLQKQTTANILEGWHTPYFIS